ncbi:hypothetical protein GOZ98_17665 [Agrobacterium vitis]|nr:hypothetical protein [Agrobacterium vitis]MVA19117.1 hypothetical protein [Agrobacterium vitis]
MAEACDRHDHLLSESDGMDWICLRPAALLTEERRTGRYALGRDTLMTREDGVSLISCADFAVAMLDLRASCESGAAPYGRMVGPMQKLQRLQASIPMICPPFSAFTANGDHSGPA